MGKGKKERKMERTKGKEKGKGEEKGMEKGKGKGKGQGRWKEDCLRNVGRNHGRTHARKGDFILCPMLCTALDRHNKHCQSRDHSICHHRFTIKGPSSTCVYLAPLWRYSASKMMGS